MLCDFNMLGFSQISDRAASHFNANSLYVINRFLITFLHCRNIFCFFCNERAFRASN